FKMRSRIRPSWHHPQAEYTANGERSSMYLEKFSLHGRRALVTGSGRGIGAEIARALAEAGAEVVIVDIDGAAAEEAASVLRSDGHAAHHRQVDLSDADAVEALAEDVTNSV